MATEGQNLRYPEFDPVPNNLPVVADFISLIYHYGTDKVYRATLEQQAAALAPHTNQVRGGLKIARDLTRRDSLPHAKLSVGTPCVVLNAVTADEDDAGVTKGLKTYMLVYATTDEEGSFLIPVDEVTEQAESRVKWVESSSAEGQYPTVLPFNPDKDRYEVEETMKFTAGGSTDLYEPKQTLIKPAGGTIPAPTTGGADDPNWRKLSVATGGGQGATFPPGFRFNLGPGKYLGKYSGQDTPPWEGLNAVQALQDAGVETIRPTYSPAQVYASHNAATDDEIGTSTDLTITGAFQQNDAGALAANGLRVYRGNQAQVGLPGSASPITRNTTIVRTATPVPIWAAADYLAGPVKNNIGTTTPDDRPAQVRSPNAPQAAEVGYMSQVVYLNGPQALFYGPTSAAPTTSVAARALPQKGLISQGNTFQLNTGAAEKTHVIVLPPGRTLGTVFDLDSSNANLRANYIEQTPVQVLDPSGATYKNAQGNAATSKVYALFNDAPYSANHRHEFTLI